MMPEALRETIHRFLAGCRRPALLEPGEELLPLSGDNFALEVRGSRLTLQAWTDTRNLVRRVTALRAESAGRLELVVERFARREGRLFVLDLDRRAGHDAHARGERLVFRELFREMLCRQYPGWELAELSADPDLQHSLSPAYPRALLRRGQSGLAAMAAPAASGASGMLTFALVWLDYLRRREPRLTIGGLALFLPAGDERTTCLRVRHLDPAAARYELFAFSTEGFVAALDPADVGNLDTRLEVCRAPAALPEELAPRLAAIPGFECVPREDGALSLRVRGVEFAQAGHDAVRFGLRERTPALASHFAEIEALAREVARVRQAEAADREHPLYRQGPEAWLESEVRRALSTIDTSLRPEPLYGQVPAVAGTDRGVLDLLAADYSGRLAVIELKASQDPQLPLQALDYWMRVRWHLAAGDFQQFGYFRGLPLRPDPPRMLLLAPALEFHPTTETVLSFFSPAVAVERIGVGVEWRKGLRVMFRLRGAERPCFDPTC
ncbi:MAG: hypothetical protein ACE15B_10095 [Bryobacteraceae bacterium]